MAGIYVHIPFCHAKCAYCDFYSLGNRKLADRFIAAATEEIHCRLGELGGEAVKTVYFGGGTPSSLSAEQLSAITDALPLSDVEEFTIEVNPEDVDRDNALAWRRSGINRVSMGVQSLNDSELKAVGRRHTASDALRAVETLKQAGFDNISLDLIYGLPGQDIASWERSVDGILECGAAHLSAYLLSYEPGTALTRRLERGLVEEASEDLATEMYELLCAKTAAAGMEHYEISNFAIPGRHSRHNSSYWDLTPYLGIGPGAHSLGADMVRRYHPADIKQYLANPQDIVAETETHREQLDDLLIISLRTRRGLDTGALAADDRAELLAKAAPSLASGMLRLDGNRLSIEPGNWLRADAIIRDLIFAV